MSPNYYLQIGVTTVVICFGLTAQAHDNHVTVAKTAGDICITSNGLPDHETGTFPRKGNPNRIREQNIRFCVPANPVKGEDAQYVRTTGFAKNGVMIRPGTADYFDSSSPRGHSHDPSSGWLMEGMGAGEILGLDAQNAHVDHNGIYHYHGVPKALDLSSDTLLGWAADGFEIHYVGTNARPSWQLKTGTRPTAPGGNYDGTFIEDYEFTAGSGNLDECNGGMLDGQYVYFATDTYPFYPRCLYGTKIRRFR